MPPLPSRPVISCEPRTVPTLMGIERAIITKPTLIGEEAYFRLKASPCESIDGVVPDNVNANAVAVRFRFHTSKRLTGICVDTLFHRCLTLTLEKGLTPESPLLLRLSM